MCNISLHTLDEHSEEPANLLKEVRKAGTHLHHPPKTSLPVLKPEAEKASGFGVLGVFMQTDGRGLVTTDGDAADSRSFMRCIKRRARLRPHFLTCWGQTGLSAVWWA